MTVVRKRSEAVQVFESYSYNTATVKVDWMPTAVTLIPGITLPDFEIDSVKTFRHAEVGSLFDETPSILSGLQSGTVVQADCRAVLSPAVRLLHTASI